MFTCSRPLEDIHILLTLATIPSLSYTTKLFKNTDTLPFWREQNQTLLPNCETTVVAVFRLNDIKPSVTSNIVVNSALSYKIKEKTIVMPVCEVVISSLDTCGDDFDALSSNEFG